LQYPNEFTIRWKRPSGVKTEIHKIKEGLVDYILYGFVDKEENKLIKYFIGDLDVFRECNVEPIAVKQNNPPDSLLGVFNLAQFPKEFVLKAYQL